MKTLTTTLAIAAACLSVLTYAAPVYACGEMAEISAPTAEQLDALRKAAERAEVGGDAVLTIRGTAFGENLKGAIVEVDAAGTITIETHGDGDTVLFLYDADNRLIAAANDIGDPMVETTAVDEAMANQNAQLPEDQQITRDDAASNLMFWVLYRCCGGESVLSRITVDLEPGKYLAVVGEFYGAPTTAGLTVRREGAELTSESVESLQERIAKAQAELADAIVAKLSDGAHELTVDGDDLMELTKAELGAMHPLATLETQFDDNGVVVIRFTIEKAPEGSSHFTGAFELLNMETPENAETYPSVSIFSLDGRLVSRHGIHVEPGTYFAVISGASWFPNGITVNLSAWNQG